MFTYCGNNPVNRIDPTGEAWWHWALGAVVVVACAAATVVTCGGSLAAAATAVGMVASGGAAFSTASTVAAGAFIGSSTVYGMTALSAASDSRSAKEFNDKGNWETVATTAGGAIVGGAIVGGASAYFSTKNTPQAVNNTYNLNGSKDSNYVSKRGWNSDMISNAINNGKQGTSVNMANGAPCTVYCYPGTNNQYVVIENESRSIVQVSNFYDTGWIPDSRIVWAPQE